ncbi:MAG: ACP S-malonyltransferase [Caldilineales bacterium]|nr:ACP S-malonyltransferase [Caldilineales bacterium]MDW8318116.1 ACP S-malonyltransferase [Anaerolineae bacterium]
MSAIALLFPGQGSQTVGMAQELAARYRSAADTLAEADALLGFSLSSLCFYGPADELTDTINAQPALLAASVAAWRAVQEAIPHFPTPAAVAGHSMGEYSALVAAGALTFADGLRLVRERGRLMKEADGRSPGGMAAVLGLDADQMAAICQEAAAATGGIVQVANDNCPGQVVISGDEAALERAMAAAGAAGARKVVRLAVSIAAHSPLMAPAADELRRAIEATPIRPPAVPVIGNVTARPLTDVAAIREELVAQLTAPVRWTESMRYLVEQGITTTVELGPGDVLTGLMKRIEKATRRFTVADPAGIETLREAIAA